MVGVRWPARAACVAALAFLFLCGTEMEALARAGAGGSSGSRGSRSMSPPSRSYSAPSPSQPSQQQRQYSPSAPPSSPSRSPFWQGLAGGLLGGLIGGMLFRSLGFAGQGMGGWGGPGLFDLILIGLLIYGIYWFVVKRRRLASELSSHSYESSSQAAEPVTVIPHGVLYQDRDPEGDLVEGITHITRMDPTFQLESFQEEAMDIFFKIQAAWAQRDMTQAREFLTDEMFMSLQKQVEELRAQRKINKLENVAVRAVKPVEIWQESGQDFITVRLQANLLDYTVDEATGRVVSGSDRDPVKFEEYWTFTRQVGPNPWKLSAITQV